jgi:hypothetical protein
MFFYLLSAKAITMGTGMLLLVQVSSGSRWFKCLLQCSAEISSKKSRTDDDEV